MIRISAPHARRKARIEIVPLIDIVFFLLATFVMVSMSMVKNQGIDVRLPQAATSASLDQSDTVTLTLTRDGSFLINKEPVAADALRGRLERLHRGNLQIGVIVNGDTEAEFGAAVRALDDVRMSGITKVAIQTRRPEA